MPDRVKLTKERIRQIRPPEEGETTVWDRDIPGFGVRVLATGVKSYIVVYRAGYGRAGTPRRITLGKVGAIRLDDAREAAFKLKGRVLNGEDPVAERRAQKLAARREALTLAKALGRYEADQQRRNVADRRNVQSALRRHLLGHVGDVPLAQVDRRGVVEAIEALEKRGLPGAAKTLRGHASTFLKWCADRGLIPANPLAGYRAQRATRAERLAQPGRILEDAELPNVWAACKADEVNATFGAFVRFLLLTGQRRSETAAMQWNEITEDGWWVIPAERTKNGLRHEVPLPPAAQELLEALPRFEGCPYVFTTNGEAPMSGWSKLMPKLRAAIAKAAAAKLSPDAQEAPAPAMPWTLHDLRRTFRSGLTKLGIDPDIAEIMLNHRPETLRAVYHRDPRLDARRAAAERWANHLAGVIAPADRAKVVSIGAG